jgi:carbamate kinase
MPDTILVALGGNALIRGGEPPSIEGQRVALRPALRGVVALMARGYRVVLTHGNGPQVGHQLLRAEAARQAEAYDVPLDVCVAQSQGEIGYLIQEVLEEALNEAGLSGKPVAVMLTRVLVDRSDPTMRDPTKPIGPYYSSRRAAELKSEGWSLAEVSGKGWRRVVPSPVPTEVLEVSAIRHLVQSGYAVVAGGGGGIPVSRTPEGHWQGIEAVVDKDWTSSLLATALGASRLVFITDVEGAKLDFGKPTERLLSRLTLNQARCHMADGHFAPGSMGPKIGAAIKFLESGGQDVIITTPNALLDAWTEKAGTHLRESFVERTTLTGSAISRRVP